MAAVVVPVEVMSPTYLGYMSVMGENRGACEEAWIAPDVVLHTCLPDAVVVLAGRPRAVFGMAILAGVGFASVMERLRPRVRPPFALGPAATRVP